MQGYSIPLSPNGRASTYGKPPKHFGGRTMSVVFKADPAALAALVPPPLEPLDEPFGVVRITELMNDQGTAGTLLEDEPEWAQYNEAVVCVPATYRGVSGNYDPFLWVDNHACAAAGREVYGLPKKMARVRLTRHFPSDPIGPGAKLSGHLEGLSRRLITASVRLTRRATIDEMPRMDAFYALRWIPSPEAEGPDVHQLLQFHHRDYAVTELWTGDATLSFGDSPNEELLPLQPTEIVAGFYMHSDWILLEPRVLEDLHGHDEATNSHAHQATLAGHTR
jgi:acetoacetate decarboxylase